VHAQDFLVYESAHGQTVEDVGEHFPELDRVAAFALVVEAIDAVDLGAFVIAPQQEEILRVLNLEAEQQRNRLDRLLASVDVVAQEQVVRFWREPSVLENSE
jgi:hypothetical protein